MAAVLDRPTLLIDIGVGAPGIAAGLAAAAASLGRDLIVFVDVGGDVLAQGDERGLRSPLSDALMLAAAGRLAADGHPVLLGIFGMGCDGELTNEEVLDRIARVAASGGLGGVRGITEPVARRLQDALALVPTEASAQAVHAFRGVSGPVTIRGGSRTLQLTSAAAATWYLDVPATIDAVGRLARAVAQATGLEQANEALHALGVRTELDLERDGARADAAAGG